MKERSKGRMMSVDQKMTSSRPYLIKALNEWIVDNQMTPYIVVNTDVEHVEVPLQYVENGKIVLNISINAVQGLQIDNACIMFSARFSGASLDIFIPMLAVAAIYAKENGQGMVFTQEPNDTLQAIDNKNTPEKLVKPHLTLVT